MTHIKVPFTEAGLDEAIRQIDEYKQKLRQKCETLAGLIAERVAWSAVQGFSSAIADDIYATKDVDGVYHSTGERPSPDVTVDVEGDGTIRTVFASGSDAIFVEFGAGVYYNGAAGSSPHPEGPANGFAIGTYGKGKGARQAWGFKEDGVLKMTHGTPAAMPMYHGVQDAIRVMIELAKEVFSV